MPIKVAIIGLGKIGMTSDWDLNEGEHIYSHARAFNKHPEFELVAGIDSSEKQRDLYQSNFPGITLKELTDDFSHLKPDVVAITVPTAEHFQTLKKVLELSSPKVILCEKPLSYDVTEAKEMIKLCKERNVELYVNFIRRADSAVKNIKQKFIKKEIEMPVKGVVWYSKGMMNNGSHFLDLLQYWLGEIISIKKIQDGRELAGDEEPDFTINLQGGQVSFHAAAEENFSHYTIELIAPNGRLRYDLGGQKVLWQPCEQSKVFEGYKYLAKKEIEIENCLSQIQWHVVDQIAMIINAEMNNEHNISLCSGKTALAGLKSLASIRKN